MALNLEKAWGENCADILRDARNRDGDTSSDALYSAFPASRERVPPCRLRRKPDRRILIFKEISMKGLCCLLLACLFAVPATARGELKASFVNRTTTDILTIGV